MKDLGYMEVYEPPQRQLGLDPRVPIIAQMAGAIFREEKLYRPDKYARSYAIDQAFLLYGEIVIRLAENDK